MHTVLVVDDSSQIRLAFTKLLKHAGYRPLVAFDGASALDVLANEHIDLVLLDLMMPVLNGRDTLRAMRGNEKTANLPVLVLTAMILTDAEMHELYHLGVAGVLRKADFGYDELTAAITQVLAQLGGVAPESDRPAAME
jgi:DNA-binding response OmpR family regulator